MKRYKLTEPAAGDIRGIADYISARFGRTMRAAYTDLIRLGVADIVAAPLRHGAASCRDMGDDILAYHLRHVRQKLVKAPRYLIVYRLSADGFITILRVLHDRMEPSRHVDNDN